MRSVLFSRNRSLRNCISEAPLFGARDASSSTELADVRLDLTRAKREPDDAKKLDIVEMRDRIRRASPLYRG